MQHRYHPGWYPGSWYWTGAHDCPSRTAGALKIHVVGKRPCLVLFAFMPSRLVSLFQEDASNNLKFVFRRSHPSLSSLMWGDQWKHRRHPAGAVWRPKKDSELWLLAALFGLLFRMFRVAASWTRSALFSDIPMRLRPWSLHGML